MLVIYINDQTFFIKGNGTNNIYIGSGVGSISLSGYGAIKTYSTGMSFYSAGIFSNYYGGQIGLTNSSSNTFYINGNGTNDINIICSITFNKKCLIV